MIRFGHTWSEIQDYTYPQIRLFVESAARISAEERRDRLIETSIAAQGTNQQIKSALKELGE